jgi:hypothetical protein
MLVVVSSNVSSHRNEVHIYKMHAHKCITTSYMPIRPSLILKSHSNPTAYTHLQFANPLCWLRSFVYLQTMVQSATAWGTEDPGNARWASSSS